MSQTLSRVLAVALIIGTCASANGAPPPLQTQPTITAGKAPATGSIDALSPVGVGAAGSVTFTATASFHGVGSGSTAETHTITVHLIVLDDSGNIICNVSQPYTVTSEGQGCANCATSCTETVPAGVYFLNATLMDVGPSSKVLLSIKSAGVILQ